MLNDLFRTKLDLIRLLFNIWILCLQVKPEGLMEQTARKWCLLFPADSQMSADLCGQDGTLVTTTTVGTGTGVAALHVVQARPLWPTGPALTARIRRLINAYQRFTLRREPMLRHDYLLHDGLVGMGIGGAGAAHTGHHTGGPLAWQLGEELRRCSVVATEPDPLFLEWQRR